MTASTSPGTVTAAEAARLLGVTRQRVLELARSAPDFPPAQPAPAGGQVWPRAAVEAWAATYPDPGQVYTGPELPPLFDHAPHLDRMADLAADEAFALNHDRVGLDHLVLAMLHPSCPGAARAVLESFGVRAEPLRLAVMDSVGDPYDYAPGSVRTAEATERVLERANAEAIRLADAEVSSEHVLLALTGRWERACTATGWLASAGITAGAVRQRVVETTEGVTPPDPPELPAWFSPNPEFTARYPT
jgi:Clp amino terminal domain, pathogenicity island component